MADSDIGPDAGGAVSLLDDLPQTGGIEQLVATYLDSSLDRVPCRGAYRRTDGI